jgi:hypothetical protein
MAIPLMESHVTFARGDEPAPSGTITYAHTDGKPDIRDRD